MNSDQSLERLLGLIANIGKVVDGLPATSFGAHVSSRLARCCTSLAANYQSARDAQNGAVFISLLSACHGKIQEAQALVKLILKSNPNADGPTRAIIDESRELCIILARSIVAAKESAADSETVPAGAELRH
jgi:four helix bundle protein